MERTRRDTQLPSQISKLPTLEDLRRDLETIVSIVEKEEALQRYEDKVLSEKQIKLQRELKEADDKETKLTTELELMRQNINERKKKESELSKNAVDLKEKYKSATQELKKRQDEFDTLDNERKNLIELIQRLSEEILVCINIFIDRRSNYTI
jgi:chromosome segregation ATPase